MSRSLAPAGRLGGLAALLVALSGLSLTAGPVWVPPKRTLQALLFPSAQALLSPSAPGAPPATDVTIVRELRLPRVLLAGAAGLALGLAGSSLQGLFRNPLADPYVVGASGGAALGATLAVLGGWGGYVGGISPVPVAAFAGAFGAVMVAYTLAEAGGASPTYALLLVGAALSTLLSAAVAALLLFQERPYLQVYGWLVGGFSGRSWPVVWGITPALAGGVSLLAAAHRGMDALALGEDSAQNLGISLPRLRAAVVVGSSLLTAAAVAAGGIIGFVGLMAPHIARRLVPATHRWVLPASGLVGAALLLAADTVGRLARPPAEIPAGIFTAVLGAPFFLYLLRRQGALHRAP